MAYASNCTDSKIHSLHIREILGCTALTCILGFTLFPATPVWRIYAASGAAFLSSTLLDVLLIHLQNKRIRNLKAMLLTDR